MENSIGFVLCFLASCVSKRRALPVIICAYYAAYFVLGSQYLDAIAMTVQQISNPVALYETYVAIGLAVIGMCLFCAIEGLGRAYWLVGYACVVFVFMLFDAIQLVSEAAGGNKLLITTYSILQHFAVPLDLIFAWLGSDNAVSRRFYNIVRNRGSINSRDIFSARVSVKDSK